MKAVRGNVFRHIFKLRLKDTGFHPITRMIYEMTESPRLDRKLEKVVLKLLANNINSVFE